MKTTVRLMAFLAIVVLVVSAGDLRAAGRGEPGPVFPARIALADEEADLRLLHEMDLDIDGVSYGEARVYLVREELDKLRALGFDVTVLPDEAKAMADREKARRETAIDSGEPVYHTYDTLTSELAALAEQYDGDPGPDILRVSSIGQSVQGRELWMVQISLNPDAEVDETEFAYISSMHGDEVVGKELCFDLIEYLTSNYGTDSRVTDLVDNTDIWILPSMNPDGTALHQRYNANNYDLNRNFPDQFIDPVNTPDGRQIEVQHVMQWATEHSPDLSMNFHGGELVMNYPFDSNPESEPVFSPAPDPDHDFYYSISRTYADNNPPMKANNSHPAFDNGVTNGADWYDVNGALQDWAYVFHGNYHVLNEVSYDKWPAASTLPTFWAENLESMLSYMERVHEGVRGLVTDADTGLPVHAQILTDSNPIPIYTDPDVGDYHRVVLPGTYSLQVSADGYETQVFPVTVIEGPAVRYDVALQPLGTNLQHIGTRVEDGPSGDGLLTAGEAADLAVTLNNAGAAATGVTGTLVPTGWFTEVTRETATFGDIGPGASVESDAPYYGLTVDPAIPAGHKAGFAIEWATAEGASGTSAPFFLDVGAPTCESTPATDVPQDIADYQWTNSQISVAANLEIDEVRVAVNVQHTYIGDLWLVLTSPEGTEVALHKWTGGSADDIVGTYGVDLTPFEPLSTLLGESSMGTWQLAIHDNAAGDTGVLNSWSVEICANPEETSTPEMRFGDFSVDAGDVTLRWWPYPGMTSYHVYRSNDPTSAGTFVEVTSEDPDDTDTIFVDTSTDPLVYWLVTADGPQGEGPMGHFEQ